MGRAAAAGMLALGLVWPGTTRASEAGADDVLQPIVFPDGIVLSHVTFAGYFGPGSYRIDGVGAFAALTCLPSAVRSNRGLQNANAASLPGFAVHTMPGCSQQPGDGVCGDTVKLVLEVPRSIPAESPLYIEGSSATLDKLIAATVECVLVNAASVTPDLKYISLHVRGPARFRRYSRVYSAATFRHGPRKRVFD